MTASSGGAALYTPDLLALAVSLAGFPLEDGAPFTAEARSRTCGSRVTFGCSVDTEGAIRHPGVRASACAVGQAAAAIFVGAAAGRDRAAIARARDAIGAWLDGTGGIPDWPGIGALDTARLYPGRHGAIVLAWDAALAALSNARDPG